jgi:hypothetical protein
MTMAYVSAISSRLEKRADMPCLALGLPLGLALGLPLGLPLACIHCVSLIRGSARAATRHLSIPYI